MISFFLIIFLLIFFLAFLFFIFFIRLFRSYNLDCEFEGWSGLGNLLFPKLQVYHTTQIDSSWFFDIFYPIISLQGNELLRFSSFIIWRSCCNWIWSDGLSCLFQVNFQCHWPVSYSLISAKQEDGATDRVKPRERDNKEATS